MEANTLNQTPTSVQYAPDNPAQNPYSDLLISKHGYCVVQADKTSFRFTAYDADNKVIDRILLRSAKAAVAK